MTQCPGDHSVSCWPWQYTFAFLLLLTWTACSTPTGKLPKSFLHVQVKKAALISLEYVRVIVNLPLQWDVKRHLSGCPEEKIRPVHT